MRVVGLTATVLTASVLATPPGVAGGRPAVAHQAVDGIQQYRLVTGDTVRVLARPDGAVSATVAGHRPFIWTGAPTARYVVPRTPAAQLRHLDLSLFDITALARVTRDGRTPVVIRLRPDVRPTRLRGLRVDAASARSVGRTTQVHASYGPGFTGFSARALQDIASVRLAGPAPRVTRRADVPTHTVRVHVARKNGSPADFAMVTLQATVDGDSLLEQKDVNGNGVAAFTNLPEGEYSTVVQTFEKILVDPQFDVAADTAREMNLGDATVKPSVSLPDHRKVWKSLVVERDPETGFGIPFGSGGYFMRAAPTSVPVLHGALHTAVTATFVRGRKADGYDDIAVTADDADGIPADLTFIHHRRDFARVTDLLYGNGPAGQRPFMLIPGNTHMDLFGGETELMTPVPGRLHVWMQAGPDAYLQQTVFPLAGKMLEGDLTQFIDVSFYRRTGTQPPITFAHGPVGPGLELPPHSPYGSGVVRKGDRLTLAVPMMSGGGRRDDVYPDAKDVSWSLRRGAHVLARGHRMFGRVVHVPHRRVTLQLSASSHPGRPWDLSNRVNDVWTFHSRAGQHDVPLLTPRYVPPTDLAGRLQPGPTGFRLAFHSSPHSARVAQVSFELSTNDGRTWHQARVTRRSGLVFHVGFRAPSAQGAARYLSMRVTARDARGSRVVETAIHACRLR